MFCSVTRAYYVNISYDLVTPDMTGGLYGASLVVIQYVKTCNENGQATLYTVIAHRLLPVAPANKRRPPNAVSKLGQRRRRWLSLEPPLAELLVLVAVFCPTELLESSASANGDNIFCTSHWLVSCQFPSFGWAFFPKRIIYKWHIVYKGILRHRHCRWCYRDPQLQVGEKDSFV